jgi:hypothetical protein
MGYLSAWTSHASLKEYRRICAIIVLNSVLLNGIRRVLNYWQTLHLKPGRTSRLSTGNLIRLAIIFEH